MLFPGANLPSLRRSPIIFLNCAIFCVYFAKILPESNGKIFFCKSNKYCLAAHYN